MTGTSTSADALPYGLRQVMLTPFTDAQGTVLSNVSYPLPVAMTLGFSETEQFDELRGDDVLVAVHGRGAQVDWSLEAGGISITAWSIVSGAKVIEEGVMGSRITRLRKSGDDQRPYFRIDGRAISDEGGNFIGRIYKAKANGRLQADLRGGAFQTSRIDGIGMPLTGDQGRWLYEFIIHEDADQALALTPEGNPLPIPTNLRAGTLAATSAQLFWDEVPGFGGTDEYAIQESIDAGVTWTTVLAAAGGETTAPTATVTSLTTATAYKFRVAYNKDGSVLGDFSRPISVTTP
jgi:hypothetical protein